MQEIGSSPDQFSTKTLYFDGLYIFYGGMIESYFILQRKPNDLRVFELKIKCFLDSIGVFPHLIHEKVGLRLSLLLARNTLRPIYARETCTERVPFL